MSKQRMFFGAVFTVASLVVFSLSGPAMAAPGQSNNGGGYNGGFGGGGYNGGLGGGGYNAGTSGGGYSAGHASGGYNAGGASSGGGHPSIGSGGGQFTRPSPFAGGHSGGGPLYSPNSGSSAILLPSQLGGIHGPMTTHPYGPYGGPGWQQSVDRWLNGQYWTGHWNWYWGSSGLWFPNYFVFLPYYYYGSYGYYNPYAVGYNDPSYFYALYGDGDSGLPPPNVAPANPLPPVAGGGVANPGVNNAAGNIVGNNPAGNNVAADLVAADVPNPNALGDASGDAGDNSAGAEFYAQAEAAFKAEHYRDALRLANHAAVESPRNPKAHELMSLSMFASGDYRGAAIEAHMAIALGPVADWATLFGYYGDGQRYTTQLRALEKYSRDNPKAGDARFLRAYHYLMTGHVDAAKEQLAEAVKLTPKDKLAVELLKKYSANPPGQPAAPVPPVPQAPPGGAKAQPDGFAS